MRSIVWKKKGSRVRIDGKMGIPVYDCCVKIIDETKLIYWIDCTCWNFANRRLRSVGEFSDRKHFAEPCKHLKLVVDALIKQGYTLKQPKAMEGPERLTAEVRRGVIERSGGTCEFPGCFSPGQTFHRNVRGSNGGRYTVPNTRHLCFNHHKFLHASEFPGCKGK